VLLDDPLPYDPLDEPDEELGVLELELGVLLGDDVLPEAPVELEPDLLK